MKKLLLVSGLAAASVLMSGMAAAQAVGKVLSSTPVTKKVTEPKTTCTNDANGKQQCQTKSVTENRTVAYNVVYEYAGNKHTAQMSYQPGPTIELEVTPRAVTPAKSTAAAKPQAKPQMQAKSQPQVKPQSQTSYSAEAQPQYSAEAPRTYSYSPPTVYSSQQDEVVERYVREPVYVEPVYYPRTYSYPRTYYSPVSSYYSPRPYYSSSYYADPFYPIVGLALGYTAGRYGYGWRSGSGHHHGHHGHRGHWRR